MEVPLSAPSPSLTEPQKIRVIYAVMDSCRLDDWEGWENNLKIVGKLFPDLFPSLA
jgi:hypothetical protein